MMMMRSLAKMITRKSQLPPRMKKCRRKRLQRRRLKRKTTMRTSSKMPRAMRAMRPMKLRRLMRSEMLMSKMRPRKSPTRRMRSQLQPKPKCRRNPCWLKMIIKKTMWRTSLWSRRNRLLHLK